MRCRSVRRRLVGYADAGLTGEESGEIRRHLEGCPACAGLAGKLELSGRALASASTPQPSEEAEARMRSGVSAPPALVLTGGLRGVRRAPVLAAAGAALVALIALSVFAGVRVSRTHRESPPPEADSLEESFQAGTRAAPGGETAPGEALTAVRKEDLEPLPRVLSTANDYSEDSLKEMVDGMELREGLASAYTMSDALRLSASFRKTAALEVEEMGEDGAALEAMLSYVSTGEPALLPFYLERARFSGRPAWVVCFAAPPRSGESVSLSRVEVWVLDPVPFFENPDSSVVFFMERRHDSGE